MFGRKKYIIEKQALRDGRVVTLFKKGLLKGDVYVPASVLNDGFIGEKINFLKECEGVKVRLLKDAESFDKLLEFAMKKKAIVFKIGEKRNLKHFNNVNIIDIDELSEELSPKYKPGEEVTVRIVKKGKNEREGVGYLRNGMKVIVKEGIKFIGKYTEVIIKGMISTPAGRIVFAELKYKE